MTGVDVSISRRGRSGPRKPSRPTAADAARFALLLTLLALCLLLGGGSRNDIAGLAILQPVAVILAVTSLLLPERGSLRQVAPLLGFMAALAAIMIVQLVPLPPGLWTRLPGHDPFAAAADAAGLTQPWRPISLTPDLTLASLVGLTVPASVIILMGGLSVPQRHRLLPYLAGGALLSAVVGVIQIAGGPQSSLYMYKIANFGAAVGFFSNRNHQAALLLMAIPMLALWARRQTVDPRYQLFRVGVAGAAVAAMLPMLAVTGSRTGIVLAPFALVASALIFRGGKRNSFRKGGRPAWLPFLVVAAIALGGLLLGWLLWRTEGVERLTSMSVIDDQRVRYLPVTAKMLTDFLPFGSGFGSFDPVFRHYEPLDLLHDQYFNHAHNDLLELGITGGVLGYMLLLAFIGWFIPLAIQCFRRKGERADQAGFASLGAVMIGVLLISSIFDYPLRTPLMGAVFAIACIWLIEAGRGGTATSRP